MNDFDKISIYEKNRYFVLNNKDFKSLIEEIEYHKEFIDNLDELNYSKILHINFKNLFLQV